MLARVGRVGGRLFRGLAYATAFATVATVIHDYGFASKTPAFDPIGIPQETTGKTFACDTNYISKLFGAPSNPEMTLQFEELGGGLSGPTLTRVSINQGSNPDPNIPNSFIAKYMCMENLPPRAADERFAGIFIPLDKMHLHEPVFYQKYKPETDKFVSSPRCYHAVIEDHGVRSPLLNLFDLRSKTRTLLILEDLGKHTTVVGKDIPQDQAEVGVKALARLHAGFWNRPPELSAPFIYTIHFCQNWFLSRIIPWGLTKKNIDGLHEKLKGKPEFDDLFSKQENIETLYVLAKNFKSRILPLTQGTEGGLFNNKILCHGDYHPGNQFHYPNGDVNIFDWQFFGKMDPASELCYFLNLAVPPDAQGDEALTKIYWKELISHGVDEKQYSYKQLETEVAIRNLAMCSSFMGFTCLADPKEEERKAKGNLTKEAANKLVPYILTRVMTRATTIVQHYGDDLNFPKIEQNPPK